MLLSGGADHVSLQLRAVLETKQLKPERVEGSLYIRLWPIVLSTRGRFLVNRSQRCCAFSQLRLEGQDDKKCDNGQVVIISV